MVGGVCVRCLELKKKCCKVRNGDYEKYAKWIMKILILNSYQIVKNVWFFSLQYTDGPYLLEFDYSLFTWLISSQWNVFVKKR